MDGIGVHYLCLESCIKGSVERGGVDVVSKGMPLRFETLG